MTATTYRTFLTSADVATWTACLDDTLQAMQSAVDVTEREDALAEGLCIAIYLGWMARSSGDLATAEHASDVFDSLRSSVVSSARSSTEQQKRCSALVLLRSGYVTHAADLLGATGVTAPELAVLLVKRNDVSALVALRDLVRGPTPTSFLPAVYTYVQALVNVGAVQEALRLLETGAWGDDEPLLLEVRGGIHERLGQWPAALRVYERSSWPEHRYRAAVIGTFAQSSTTRELAFDEPMRRVLFELEGGDLDQVEMARCAAFLNACQWQPVVTWIVEFELGKLSFRRRQFAEADVHFRRALSTAPPDARSPIARLRFLNLTWLTGQTAHLRLDLTPEALTAGYEAIALGGDADTSSSIRVWVANLTGDHGLLPATLDEWEQYERGQAFSTVGHTARAIDCWLESLGTAFYHRAAANLIHHFTAAGLTLAVIRLSELVWRESADDYLALWEICNTLQRLPAIDDPAGDDAGLGSAGALASEDTAEADQQGDLLTLIEQHRERLVDLSQFDFMNAIRTHELLQHAGYEDVAEELLLRAAKQADGVSELLAVAVLRSGTARSVHSDHEALRCLYRARNIARDRLERLEIAREFLHYGFARESRAILAQDGILREDTSLAPSEMVVALQCAPALAPEEYKDLVTRAVTRLNHDVEGGLLGPCPWAYGDRLLATVGPSNAQAVAARLDTRLTEPGTTSAWAGGVDDEWDDARQRLDELLDDDADETGATVETRIDDILGSTRFGLRVLAVGHLRTMLTELQEQVRTITPVVPARRTPVGRCYDDVEGPRVIELCDLWRSRILANGADDAAVAQLGQFFETEQTLLEEWERGRRDAAAPPLDRMVRVAAALGRALQLLLDVNLPEREHAALRAVFEGIELDVHASTSQVAEQVDAARRVLAEVRVKDPAGR